MKTFVLNNYTIKISDEFKNKHIQFAFSKEEADECVHKLINKANRQRNAKIDPNWAEMMGINNTQFIENTIEARPVYDFNNTVVCYVIIDTKDFEEYLNNNMFLLNADGNIIRVCYAPRIKQEEAAEFSNTYENFIHLASEYETIDKKEKDLLTSKYQTLSSKDLSVIDFNPDSVWYQKNNVEGRCGLIKKCANQFLLDETNNIDSPVHELFTLGFVENEYTDIRNVKTKTNIHYAFNCNTVHYKDITADNVRIYKYIYKDEPYTYTAMKYERTNNYRKELYSTNKIPHERNRCVYCGQFYQPQYIEADHIIPVSAVKGAKGKYWKKYMDRHHYTLGVNDPKNIVPACIYCNRRKGSKQGIWLLLGRLGRHKFTWTLRSMTIWALSIYILIKTFGQNENYYLIHLDKLFILLLIIGLSIANTNIHHMLAEKAYKKRLENK